MQRTSFKPMHCSLAQALELTGEWWTPLILRDLFLGLNRFDELVENLGISRNLLTRRLAKLLRAKLVERTIYLRRPVRYAYRLSPAGEDLVPILVALTLWGDRWNPPARGGTIDFVHTRCGHALTPRMVCSECSEPIDAKTIRAAPRPGARPGPGIRVIARKLAESA
jgi:DNA-binding HxlR family transcriptional regulator